MVPSQAAGAAKPNANQNKEEEKATEKIIRQQRHNTCDSQIVKIMKTHKTVPHTDLVQKVIAAISLFKAQPPMIKERIGA